MEALFNLSDFESVLDEFNSISTEENEERLSLNMSAEMAASEKRYNEYIRKHDNI